MTIIMSSIQQFFLNKVLLVALTVVAMGSWTFLRVSQIKPAILGDEWVYVVTSRVDSPWSANPSYDLGNYLFNFVYQSTNLCSDSFYSCGKFLNLIFFTGFVLILFAIALRFLPFLVSYIFLISVYLSPLSIYVSMYLPESLYFMVLAAALYAVVRVMDSGQDKWWITAGVMIGLAALVKPHALFAAMAFGIYLIISNLGRAPFVRTLLLNVGYFVGGFLAARLVVGLLVAGPKSLNILGAYGATNSVGEFVTGAGGAIAPTTGTLVGAGPVVAAVQMFLPQLGTHTLVVSALFGGVLAALLMAVLETFRRRTSGSMEKLTLLIVIWLLVMLIIVALFTGWVTGAGDDHTTRVLLRYYEHMIPIATLGALVFAFNKEGLAEAKPWVRITAAAAVFSLTSVSFAGFFSGLAIQIADAPSVAGLVVDVGIFNLVGVVVAFSILTLAFFPKVAPVVLLASIAATSVGTGWVTTEKYIEARGEFSAADTGGQFARGTVPAAEVSGVYVIANSRFDGRVASLWMESDNPLAIVERGAFIEYTTLETSPTWVLAIGEAALTDFIGTSIVGDGYILYQVTGNEEIILGSGANHPRIKSLEGFSAPMGDAIWTTGNEAQINLNSSLPANAKVELTLNAMPGILGQEVQVTVGDSTVILSIQDFLSEKTLEIEFSNTEPADELKILIPEVKSSLEVGAGVDENTTGLGLLRMKIAF